jgi:two-component system cell cycle response regulator
VSDSTKVVAPETPRLVRWALIACLAWVAAYATSCWLPHHPLNGTILGKYASDGVMLSAGILCALRGSRMAGGERTAWTLIAAGIAAWGCGDLYWSTALSNLAVIPVPSPADVGYLLFVPLTFAGLVVLARARLAGVPRTLAADGVSAALAVGAVCAAIVVQAVLGIGGSTREVVTNLAYPVSDMILIGLIVGAIALRGWSLDRTWGVLVIGTIAYGITDSLYLVTVAKDTYTYPSLFDFGWTGAAVLYAWAAWQRVTPPTPTERQGGMREIVLPLGFALMGLAVLIYADASHVNALAVALAAASLLAVMVRLTMTFAENLEMLRASRFEALTDSLTGLGNRRALSVELARQMRRATQLRPLVLVLFDLDGFKYYNDNFGHPAGDELLSRLGRRLSNCLEGRGTAFRMGGDEFCALIEPGEEVAQPIIETAVAALTERGEGFAVGCSHGAVVVPLEAQDPADALRLSDQRMYAAKQSGRASAGSQSKEVLLQALTERDPELREHVSDVARLAVAVAHRLGLAADRIEQVRQAAELHDVGKVAIPDAILRKPGPLDDHEWAFIRRHTLVGERIITAAPALERVAALVRSSHERYDGGGYPDGLAATDIPLGSRIVAICDAFDAMTSDRAYRAAMTPAAALAELRACAGTQFDPVVVETFCAAWVDLSDSQVAKKSATA